LVNRLANRVAIVTGAGQGIGGGIARVLGGEGAKILIADINEKTGGEMASRISSVGGTAEFVRADLSKQADAEKVAETALDRFGRIDILCQNVGIFPVLAFDHMTEEVWDRVMNVNLKSAFFVIKACIPQMQKQRYGRIVVTSSITGPRVAAAGLSHYGASKGGLNGLIKGIAYEEARYNITVNGIEPGSVLTEGTVQANEALKKKVASLIPLGRLATPEEIGTVALFLASDDSQYMTGQTIIVDGGQTIVEWDMEI
jgi:3-oxoacyl-[acyl-carrier protein] reductase